jgi:tryptophan-rich sensory protein
MKEPPVSKKPQAFQPALWHGLVFFVAIQALSAAGGISSREVLFDGFIRAPLTPPGWVFPIVWTTLVILQIWALGRVLSQPRLAYRRALLGLQAGMWLLYLSFTPLYFGLGSPILGFAVVVAYWLLAGISISLLWPNNRKTALLLVPLALWLSWALYLSAYGALYNPDPFWGTGAVMGFCLQPLC